MSDAFQDRLDIFKTLLGLLFYATADQAADSWIDRQLSREIIIMRESGTL
jgi:hypothetical protein